MVTSAFPDRETELVERARTGDLAAFEQLVSPLIEPASQLAAVILRDWHEAEDAVQEGAFKAWRAVGRLRVALSADVDRAMGRLQETERLILFLHFYPDLPVEEVGRVLGLTAEATRSRMYRATRRLRPALKDGEER